jgi:hypothetical protein
MTDPSYIFFLNIIWNDGVPIMPFPTLGIAAMPHQLECGGELLFLLCKSIYLHIYTRTREWKNKLLENCMRFCTQKGTYVKYYCCYSLGQVLGGGGGGANGYSSMYWGQGSWSPSPCWTHFNTLGQSALAHVEYQKLHKGSPSLALAELAYYP